MGRYRGPKHKLSRREGKDLFGTGGPSLERRLSQPPGMHGRTMRQDRQSDYSRHLREKQKVKRMYGMREKEFRRLYKLAQQFQEETGVALLKLLERRLDNVIYRLGFARTRPQARQLVNHGHAQVDGHRVDIPSYLLRLGQTVVLNETARQIPDVRNLQKHSPSVPGWLKLYNGIGRVIREPDRREIDHDINEQLIVAFYSR